MFNNKIYLCTSKNFFKRDVISANSCEGNFSGFAISSDFSPNFYYIYYV